MPLRHPLALLALLLAFASNAATAGAVAEGDPNDGRIVDGVYQNSYFGFGYPILPGWTEDRPRTVSTYRGEYSLLRLTNSAVPGASLEIRAEDQFFSDFAQSGKATGAVTAVSDRLAKLLPKHPPDTALGEAEGFNLELSLMQNVQIERPPTEQQLGERRFARIDFRVDGTTIHTYLVIVSRCHSFRIEAVAPSQDTLDEILASLHRLTMTAANDPALPVCSKDYATPATLVARVEPDLGGQWHMPIPVRILIAPDGSVRHVHVIAATPEQRGAVEAAMARWRFIPSGAVAVETDITLPAK